MRKLDQLLQNHLLIIIRVVSRNRNPKCSRKWVVRSHGKNWNRMVVGSWRDLRVEVDWLDYIYIFRCAGMVVEYDMI